MPNWCEGSLKVRGTIAQLREFVLNGLHPVDWRGDHLPEIKLEDPESDTSILSNGPVEGALWIKGTRRHFCKPYFIEVYAENPKEKVVLVLPFKAAWGIEAEDLRKVSESYHVDMKIFGVERGMQFCQDIEIADGVVIKSEQITYDDWDWDCPFPEMGG